MNFLVLTLCMSSVFGEDWHGQYSKVFPGQIKGPEKLTDRIGIVGGGPSGIHMAYLLKMKGFKNVQVLEATQRIGGKSRSIKYRGALHEMGTCYLSADYQENVLKLVNKFTSGQTKPPPIASVWTRITPDGQSFEYYNFIKLKMKYPNQNLTEIKGLFVRQLGGYIALHKKLFGDYYGELMPEPTDDVMEQITGSFGDFLTRNGLKDLYDMFTASFTLQGYGKLDEVPAFYGLIWNTPRVVKSLIGLMSGQPGAIYMLKDGFQALWENMVSQEKLNVRFETRVKYVHLDNDKIFVYGVSARSRRLFIKSYDFLVWTPPANGFLKSAGGKKFAAEKILFSGMTNSYYATSLVDDEGGRRADSSVNWWYDNINGGNDMAVWANRDAYTMFHNLNGANYSRAFTITGDDSKRDIRTSVFYQFSHRKPSKEDLARRLTDHLNEMGASYVSIKKQFPWRYFTRFTDVQIKERRPWRVLGIQGRRKVWFAGSSVSFESVKSVVEYNQLLVDRMKEPTN